MYKMVDVNYIKNWKKLLKKYDTTNIKDISKEKLDFIEIITVLQQSIE